ncbi:MAG: hypothetical protein AAGF12_00835 [Myxococcota bacterium]
MRSTLRQPRDRSRHPAARLLRGLWTAPTNLLGHAAGVLASGSRGQLLSGDAAVGRLYVIRLPLLRRIGGVTLGHAILLSPRYTEGLLGRLVIAHELAHTRQHDVLGPLYLPAHIVAQTVSALVWPFARIEGSDPVHAHNPLEERWICLGHSAIRDLMHGKRFTEQEREQLLSRLGVVAFPASQPSP